MPSPFPPRPPSAIPPSPLPLPPRQFPGSPSPGLWAEGTRMCDFSQQISSWESKSRSRVRSQSYNLTIDRIHYFIGCWFQTFHYIPSWDQIIIRFSFFFSNIFQLDKAHFLESERQIFWAKLLNAHKKPINHPLYFSKSLCDKTDTRVSSPCLTWRNRSCRAAGACSIVSAAALRAPEAFCSPLAAMTWRVFCLYSTQQFAGLARFETLQSFAYWIIFTILKSIFSIWKF